MYDALRAAWANAAAAARRQGTPYDPKQPSHGPRYPDMQAPGLDPCGGGYVMDCRCGALSPRFRLEDEAVAWFNTHLAQQQEEAA